MVEKSLLRPSCNIFALQQVRRLEAFRRQLKSGELESRRHGAADERPDPEAPRALPLSGWHDGLGALARSEIVAEANARRRARGHGGREFERRARVPMPKLGSTRCQFETSPSASRK